MLDNHPAVLNHGDDSHLFHVTFGPFLILIFSSCIYSYKKKNVCVTTHTSLIACFFQRRMFMRLQWLSYRVLFFVTIILLREMPFHFFFKYQQSLKVALSFQWNYNKFFSRLFLEKNIILTLVRWRLRRCYKKKEKRYFKWIWKATTLYILYDAGAAYRFSNFHAFYIYDKLRKYLRIQLNL